MVLLELLERLTQRAAPGFDAELVTDLLLRARLQQASRRSRDRCLVGIAGSARDPPCFLGRCAGLSTGLLLRRRLRLFFRVGLGVRRGLRAARIFGFARMRARKDEQRAK